MVTSFVNQNKCKGVQTLGPPGAVDTLPSVVAEGGGIGGRAYVGARVTLRCIAWCGLRGSGRLEGDGYEKEERLNSSC